VDCRPRGRLEFEAALLQDDARLLWNVPIAGLPLLNRQVQCLRHVGVSEIELAADPVHHETLRGALRRLPAALVKGMAIVDLAQGPSGTSAGTLNLLANLVIDPRALRQLIQTSRELDQSVIGVDRFTTNYRASEKSPHAMGAPGVGDGQVVAASDVTLGNLAPIGVSMRASATARPEASSPVFLHVGRYTWHRVHDVADAREATSKILFSTFKPTDGVYAKTNRRVSLRISRVLLTTPVTPNQVTLFGLLCSGFAGVVMAGGTYLSFVIGGFLTWFASMIDGVDGELARAKFKATALGHWLEMTCDYAFYLAVVSGYGVGLYRASGSRVWLQLAAAGMIGVVLGFLAVARDKRKYARLEPGGDYYLAFQRRTGAHSSNPVYRFTRLANFLVSRGAFPYYIMAFAVLGLSKVMFIMVVAGTQLSWILTLYAGRLKPVPAVGPDSGRTAPLGVARPRPATDESRRDATLGRERGVVGGNG
jgi:phosphatidylglycerophosphate synthase